LIIKIINKNTNHDIFFSIWFELYILLKKFLLKDVQLENILTPILKKQLKSIAKQATKLLSNLT